MLQEIARVMPDASRPGAWGGELRMEGADCQSTTPSLKMGRTDEKGVDVTHTRHQADTGSS